MRRLNLSPLARTALKKRHNQNRLNVTLTEAVTAGNSEIYRVYNNVDKCLKSTERTLTAIPKIK